MYVRPSGAEVLESHFGSPARPYRHSGGDNAGSVQGDVVGHGGESSASIRARVVKARHIQQLRFKDCKGVHCNAQMNSRLLKTYAALTDECLEILRQSMERFDMSARAYDRILKVARTIADLDSSPSILPPTSARPSATAALTARRGASPRRSREPLFKQAETDRRRQSLLHIRQKSSMGRCYLHDYKGRCIYHITLSKAGKFGLWPSVRPFP